MIYSFGVLEVEGVTEVDDIEEDVVDVQEVQPEKIAENGATGPKPDRLAKTQEQKQKKSRERLQSNASSTRQPASKAKQKTGGRKKKLARKELARKSKHQIVPDSDGTNTVPPRENTEPDPEEFSESQQESDLGGKFTPLPTLPPPQHPSPPPPIQLPTQQMTCSDPQSEAAPAISPSAGSPDSFNSSTDLHPIEVIAEHQEVCFVPHLEECGLDQEPEQPMEPITSPLTPECSFSDTSSPTTTQWASPTEIEPRTILTEPVRGIFPLVPLQPTMQSVPGNSVPNAENKDQKNVVIIQSPADSAPTTAGMTKKLSPTTTEWALPTESILRPTPSQADFTDPVPDTLPPVQRTMQSAPADSVCHVENQDQGNVVVQSLADSASVAAGMLKKLSSTMTKWATPTETGPRPILSQDDFMDPVRDILPLVPVQRTVQSAPADSVHHVENEDQAKKAVVQIPTDSAPATAEMIKEITEDEDRGFNQSSQSPAGEKQLTWDEWKDVIQRRSILCGIRMETRLNNRLGPDVSGVSLLDFNRSMIQPAYRVETSRNEGESVSGRQMNYMRAGWMEHTLSVDPPFVSATMKVRTDRSKAGNRAENSKSFHTTHTFDRVKLTIHTDEASKHLSQTFKNELKRALGTEGDHAKRLELERLFEKWGHALATELVLGGERREISEGADNSEETKQRNEMQYTMELKPSAALGGGGGSGGVSKSRAVARSQVSKQRVESYVGGDPKFHHEDQLETWKASIEDFKHWDVIRRERAIPIIDLLKPEEKREILRVATPKPLLGRWLSGNQLEAVSCKHFKLYRPRLSQIDLDKGWRSLGHSLDPSKALIVKATEDHPDALHPVTADLSWRSKSFFHSDSFWRLTPGSTEYTALGSIYAKGGFFGGEPPDAEQTKQFCSVKTAYLTDADYKNPIMGKGIFGSAGSIWTVVSQENPDESIGLIHAVEGRDKPERSRMALNLDCVEFNSDPNNPAVRLGVAR